MAIAEEMVEIVNRLVNDNRKSNSVLPSDYCYNRFNMDKHLLNKPTVFQYVERNQYRCLGSNYPYNGLIFQQPRGQKESIVGECVDGKRIITIVVEE